MRIPGFGPRRPAVVDPDPNRPPARRPGESIEAFEARRAEYARTHPHGTADVHDQRRAYEEGRRDQHRVERATRRRGSGFGLAAVLVVLVAALGVVWLALAAREGSFAAGGALVDQKVAEVTQPARTAASTAMDRTGAAVEDAGQALESSGQRLRDEAQ